MLLYDNYILESTEYMLHECDRYINTVITNMKLKESEILCRVNESLDESDDILEEEFIDNFVSSLESNSISIVECVNSIDKLQTTSQIEYMQRKISDITYQLEQYEYSDKDYIIWLKTDFRNLLKLRESELNHSVVVKGIDFDEYVESLQESEFSEKIKTSILGPINTGRFDLIRPRLLKLARKAKDMKRIQYLRRDLSMGKRQLETLKKNKPNFSKQIDDHIKWLDTEYRQALNDRAKELKNSIRESAIEDIVAVQEGAKETIIKAIEWLINKIKEIWNKFVNNKVSRDQNSEWLVNNKNYILQKSYVGSKEIPEFWKYINNMGIIDKFPKFDYNTLKASLSSDETFIKEHLSDIYQEGTSYQDVLKSKLYGTKNAVLKDNQMPIRDMYNYCTNGYKQRYKALESAHNNCIASAERFKNDVQSGKIQLESVFSFEKYFYSYLLETVIYEEDMGKVVDNTNQTQQNNNNNTTDTKSQVDKNKEQEANQKKEQSEKVIESQKLVSRYLNIHTNIKGICMKCLDDTFDTYFSILKEHATKNGAKYDVKKNKGDNNTKQPEQQPKK